MQGKKVCKGDSAHLYSLMIFQELRVNKSHLK